MSASPPKADVRTAIVDVRFGSKADMCGAKGHVRFTPESDIKRVVKCPLWTKDKLLLSVANLASGQQLSAGST
jgi:hypothetical protein